MILSRGRRVDATCVDTFAPSHLSGRSDRRARAAVDSAEDLKKRKYASFERASLSGSWGTAGALHVFKILLGCLIEATRAPRVCSYLAQRTLLPFSVTNNAASDLGTLLSGSGLIS